MEVNSKSNDHAQQEDFSERVKRLNLKPLWEQNQSPVRTIGKPCIWKWADIHPMMVEASKFNLGSEVERRVLTMRDPNLPGGVSRTLTAALQMVLPGEVAPTHRHSLAAIRWIIEGSGCSTVQNGEKITMQKNDFIITPNDCWHDHRHEGSEPMFWLDGLDGPLIRSLGADYFEDHPEGIQPITKTDNESWLRYSTGGVRPALEIPDAKYSPMMLYRFEQVYNQLTIMRQENMVDEYDGHLLEYINPVTGGSVMPTISANIQLLAPGFHSKTHRHMSSGVYYVVKGSGHSVINGEKLDWNERDVFTVPNWSWHQHVNPNDSEVILFHYNDSPIFNQFGLYREETDN